MVFATPRNTQRSMHYVSIFLGDCFSMSVLVRCSAHLCPKVLTNEPKKFSKATKPPKLTGLDLTKHMVSIVWKPHLALGARSGNVFVVQLHAGHNFLGFGPYFYGLRCHLLSFWSPGQG